MTLSERDQRELLGIERALELGGRRLSRRIGGWTRGRLWPHAPWWALDAWTRRHRRGLAATLAALGVAAVVLGPLLSTRVAVVVVLAGGLALAGGLMAWVAALRADRRRRGPGRRRRGLPRRRR